MKEIMDKISLPITNRFVNSENSKKAFMVTFLVYKDQGTDTVVKQIKNRCLLNINKR